jgi:hypothetical protein
MNSVLSIMMLPNSYLESLSHDSPAEGGCIIKVRGQHGKT